MINVQDLEQSMTDHLENTHFSDDGKLDAKINWQSCKQLDEDPEDVTAQDMAFSVTEPDGEES
jgi:hypothetical protein